MHKIFTHTILLVALAVGHNPATANIPKPKKVTYQDLQPDIRKQIDCLADNIYFESRSEPLKGQKAVALVTMNRTNSELFPKTVCEVVKQKKKNVCQFSWWCDPKTRSVHKQRNVNKDVYQQVQVVATDVFLNYHMMEDVTKGALFFHAEHINPRWKTKRRTAKIGQHVFYTIKEST